MKTVTESCDVAVIGGGPAGAAAGAKMAQAGLKVTILEKEKFPRFCIGESLLPHGNDLLKELGVWDKLETAGFLRKYGAEFCSGDNSRRHRLWFEESLDSDHQYTYQVDRATFDQLLLNHARDYGCTVHEQTRVTALEKPDSEAMTLDCQGPGERRQITARWVIDASGRSAFAGRDMGLIRRSTEKVRRVAIYGHFEGAARNEGKAEGHITIVRIPGGWFWLIPLAHDRTSVGLVLPTKQTRTSPARNLKDIFEQAVKSSPAMTERLEAARPMTPLQATGDYSWKFSSLATRRIVLTGDAAGFVDPIFSSGILLALKSGLRAAEMVTGAEASGRSLGAWERFAYSRGVTRSMNQYGRLIRAFYDRAGFEVFMSPQPVLQIPRSVGRLVGGDTNPSLGDRLRLRLFQGVCRAQRLFDVVPAIHSLR